MCKLCFKNLYVACCPQFQTKTVKIYTLFETKTAKKTVPFGAAHTLTCDQAFFFLFFFFSGGKGVACSAAVIWRANAQ